MTSQQYFKRILQKNVDALPKNYIEHFYILQKKFEISTQNSQYKPVYIEEFCSATFVLKLAWQYSVADPGGVQQVQMHLPSKNPKK